jgi:NADH:ubiquinone oxidoreductase subunit E
MPNEICDLTRKVNDLVAHFEQHHARTEHLIAQSENIRVLLLDAIRKSEEQSRYITEQSLANVAHKLATVNTYVRTEQKRLRLQNFLLDWAQRWLHL